MKQLYRYFLGIAVIFVLMTTFLHFLPIVSFSNVDEVKARCPLPPSELRLKSEIRTNTEHKRHWPPWSLIRKRSKNGESMKLADVWDNESGEDRIVTQMEFIPSALGETKNIFMNPSDFNVPAGNKIFNNCPVQHCTIVAGVNAKTVHARMFNMQFSYLDVSRFNQAKTSDQIWIIYNLEGPLVTPDYYLLDGIFNWTASYRRDSTIVTPYERWRPYEDVSPSKKIKNYAAGKSRKAAIFVSNCDTTNGRMRYVHELQKHIDVHVYGACGDGSHHCDRFEKESACFETLRRHYKFYLSFENCNCRNYITEKFFVNAFS